jgi:Flp pilus assembly protein TadG
MNVPPISEIRGSIRTAIRTAGAVSRALVPRMRVSRGNGESGQAMVEMAYVAPVLLLLTVGMFMFGTALNKYLVLTNAVEIGGQLLAAERGETTDPCTAASNAIIAAAPNLTLTASEFTYTINGTQYAGQEGCSGTSGMVSGNNAVITVTNPVAFNVIMLGNESYTLSATVQEVIQ